MKKLIISVLLICGLCTSAIQAQEWIYVGLSNGDLYVVNVATCNTSYIGNFGIGMLDIALCPNGKFYGTDGAIFYEMDMNTMSRRNIGKMSTLLTDWVALTCDSKGVVWTMSSDTSDLCIVDTATGMTKCLGSTGFRAAGDLVWYNGQLYLAGTGNTLVLLDPNNLVGSQVIGTMTSGVNVYGLATSYVAGCSSTERKMYATHGTDILTVDPQNGRAELKCSNLFEFEIYGAATPHNGTTLTHTVNASVPNVFTPNGDGINDCFEMAEFDFIFCGELIIYNRWGIPVYRSDYDRCWDGNTQGGRQVSEGTYYWVVNSGNSTQAHGWVLLIRDTP